MRVSLTISVAVILGTVIHVGLMRNTTTESDSVILESDGESADPFELLGLTQKISTKKSEEASAKANQKEAAGGRKNQNKAAHQKKVAKRAVKTVQEAAKKSTSAMIEA